MFGHAKKIAILSNPTSGSFNEEALNRKIDRELVGWQTSILRPENLADARRAVQNLDRDEVGCLLVAGGDGTVNSILADLVDKDIPLYPLAMGTANDLAQCLGLSFSKDHLGDVLQEHGQSVKKIDLVYLNDTPMVTVGGFGVCSRVVQQFNHYRHYRGVRAARKLGRSHLYHVLALKELSVGRKRSRALRLECPELGIDRVIHTPNVFVANQMNLGRHIKVAPEARNDDGLVNVQILQHSARGDLILDFLKMLKGVEVESSLNLSAREISFTTLDDEPIFYMGDGDLLGASDTLKITVKKQALSVICRPDGP